MASGDAVVGALRVVLGLDTGALEDGIKKATSSLGSFGKAVGTIATGIGLEHAFEKGLEIAKEFFEFVIQGFERIDQIGKTAQKTGLDIEQFSGLSVAARLADTDMTSLANTLGKLSKNMADTAKGTGEAQDTFRALGINVTDSSGKLKSAGDVLGEIADKFQSADNGATKVAASITLLGRGGKELIPLLNDGSHGIQEMTEAAKNMGLVISKDTFQATQKFNDNLKLIKLAGEGMINMLIAGLIPALSRWSDVIGDTVKTGDLQRAVIERTISVIKEFVILVNQAIVADQLLGQAFNELIRAITSFPDIEASREALNNMNEIIKTMPEAMGKARDEITRLFVVISGGAKATSELAGPLSEFQKAMQKMALDTDALVGKFGEIPPRLIDMAIQFKLIDESGNTIKGKSADMDLLTDSLLKFNAAQLVNETQDPFAKLGLQIEGLNLLFDQGKISVQTYFTAIAVGVADSLGKVNQSLSFIQSGFGELAKSNKEFAIAAKAVGIAQALINTYVAATKALTAAPPPFNYALAAATVVAGLGFVAKASAQQFAAGGSFKVPGGVSGVDTTTIPLSLAAGEQVDITPAGQVGRTGAQEIVLTGIKPKDMFTGEMLRGLFDSLNNGMADGYKLKVAT